MPAFGAARLYVCSMQTRLLVGSVFFSCFAAACGSVPSTPAPEKATPIAAAASSGAGGGPGAQGEEKDKEKAAARKQKQKELRNKERELEAAKVEQQVAEIERTVRLRGIELAQNKTAAEQDRAKAELEVFLGSVRPREVEEKRIGLDQSQHRLEHSKDELGELVAMYEADEFAKTTKELVLKRGRREVEMAERHLAVAQKELQHFEQVVLPQRERELRDKVVETEHEQRKAQSEAQKARLEIALATKKEAQRLADLQEEIEELQAELAKGTP